ncbi:tetratricopeptide repeat protein [Azospirillum canadense]|uniref:tetratricopeptide repeat protein n=1 Tax=Azospirillum canadense TaxID=403962 RepID=UPI00222608B9|nr:tetratricopeptide repeat protein [Azospirillum canadense]MCW2243725.1 tetratricopeptide (TPR) repeat protein [Azospirillum canadense]
MTRIGNRRPDKTGRADSREGRILGDWLNAAIDHHRAGRLADALRLYAQILTLRADHADALHLSGIADYQAGRAESAARRFRAVIAAHPAFAEAHNSLGNTLADAGRWGEAAAAYGRAIALQPGYAEALGNLGTVRQAEGRHADALAAYNEALRLEPGRPGTLHNLGLLHQQLGDLDHAAVCFHEAVKASPGHAPAWRSLALVLCTLRHPDADACLRRALADAPDDADLAIALGTLLGERRCWAEAEAALRPALEADPSHARLRFALAGALQNQGRWAEAADGYRHALAGEPMLASAWNNLGVVLLDLGAAGEATAALRVSLALEPADAMALNNLGTGLESLERAEEAVTVYRRALAVRPDYAKALDNLGNALASVSSHEEAIRLHRMAIAAQPDHAEAYTNQGTSLHPLDRWAEALAVHRRAVRLSPRNAPARTALGLALQMLGHPEEAEAAHRAALEIDARNAEAHANLGMLLWQTNRPDEAEGPLRCALDLNPSLAAAHLNLGLVSLALGKLGIGWESYQWRFRAKGYRDRAVAAPPWRGEPMPGKRLLVWREQGVGDEILFVSCLRAAAERVSHMVVECDPRLVSLFARSFPWATVRAETLTDDGCETVVPMDCDAHIAAGALPRLARPALSAFSDAAPWLTPDPARAAAWRDRLDALGPGLKVGIGWRSQMMTTDRKAAYVTLDAFAPLFALAGVVFVNVQYGDCAAELAAAEARFGVRIYRWDDLDLRDDFEGTAALIAGLDLVITPAISAGELAGALGAPVWRLGHRDWTQLGSGVRPWFPTQRLFQPRPGEGLEDMLARMARTLDRMRNPAPPDLTQPDPAQPAPTDVDRLVADAIDHHRSGDPAAAERLCRAALDASPDHAVALHLLGVLLLRREEPAAAAAALARATTADPGNAAAHAALTDALQALGHADRAEVAQRHAIAARPDGAEHWVNHAALLRALGQPDAAEAAIGRALLLRPGLGPAHTHLGHLRAGRGDRVGAARSHRLALVLTPSGVAELVNLASALQDAQRLPEAEAQLRRAMRVAPGEAAAWSHLGSVLDQLDRPVEAFACHRRALDLAPAMAEAHANLGIHWGRQRRLEEAKAAYRDAIQADPHLATARYNLSLFLLEEGALRPGWADHEWRFGSPQFRHQARRFAARGWRGENISAARALVWREQGVGDEILFASCYPDLQCRAGHLVVECDRRLVTLFARSFPGATVRPPTPDPRDVDVQVAAGSLPRLLRPDLKRFPAQPWLVPDPQRVAFWRDRLAALGPGLKLGIAWRSQLMDGDRRHCYTALDQWGPLFALPGVTFITMQYGDCAAEIAAAEARFGVRIHRWADLNLKDDFEAVAALTVNLDLLITPAMSAGELGGALGVPVWRFGLPEWTQLGTGTRPWYPTQRLFQPRPGEGLGEVLARMAAALRGLMPQPSSVPPPPSPPPDPEALLEQAAGHHRDGRLADAAPLYERVLRLRPDHPVALHLSGLLAHQTGRSEAAAERIAAALSRTPAYAAAQASLGTVLLDTGRPDAAADRFRRALALQPASAATLTNLGNALEAGHDLEGAAAAHQRAAMAEPGLAEAHDNRGAVLTRLGRLADGAASHRRAVALAPARGAGWLNLGVALRRSGRWPSAHHALQRALALEPGTADALANLGRLLRDLGLATEAERWCDRALALDSDQPAAAFNKGLLCLTRGDLAMGWWGYDHRFRARDLAGAARVVPVPPWEGEDPSGLGLLVWREQGLGDEVLFAGCLPELIARAGSVTVECDRRLVPLFARSFPTATIRPAPADPEAPCAGIDRHVAMGSLPRLLRRRLADFPPRVGYLVPDPAQVLRWRERLAALGPGLTVGIAWRSGLINPERRGAYSAIGDWGPVVAVPGVRFVNLQYGDCAAELEEARRSFGVAVQAWPDLNLKDDLDGVAALMVGLDLVVTPASSVGEMAGALGVPVWRFGAGGDWTALGTGTRPWFPSMTLVTAPPGQPASGALPLVARRLRHLVQSPLRGGK